MTNKEEQMLMKNRKFQKKRFKENSKDQEKIKEKGERNEHQSETER